MRRIQQVLRDDRNQTETEEEEYNQRKPTYDLHKNQSSTTATATTNSSTKNQNRFFIDNLSQKSFFSFQIELFEVHYYLHRIIEMIEVLQHIKNHHQQQQTQNIQVLAKLLNQFNWSLINENIKQLCCTLLSFFSFFHIITKIFHFDIYFFCHKIFFSHLALI